MAWTLRFTPRARKQLLKLDRKASEMITRLLEDRVATEEDPRVHGRPLLGAFQGYWRFRAGDYRIICDVNYEEVLILVIAVGHRKEIYD